MSSMLPDPLGQTVGTWDSPSVQPLVRFGHAVAYDAASDMVILFGGGYETGHGGDVFDRTWGFDDYTNSWTDLNPTSRPSARVGHAMAYDSESDRVILFGGGQPSLSAPRRETWAYDFHANTWTNMTLPTAPSGREYAAMAYDSESDRAILFGGYCEGGPCPAETWAYDYNTNTWRNMAPPSGPRARSGHAMAYDAESDRIILFGGFTGIGTDVTAETWAYDYNSNAWTNLNPTEAPSPRGGHLMAYDAQTDRVVLFGDSETWGTSQAETWTYDLNANDWINVTSGTEPLPPSYWWRNFALAYDAGSHLLVLVTEDDTWVYDSGQNVWSATVRTPGARDGHAMAYDAESDRVILYSGESSRYPSETWAYDANADVWSEMSPTTGPRPRVVHAMAYDAESDRVVLFGGAALGVDWSGDALDATWAYDFNTNTWTNMSPPIAPSLRFGHAMTYDVESDRVILFGGKDARGFGPVNGETWAFDFNENTWTNMSPSRAPSPRINARIAYDVESDRVILFGGQIGENFDGNLSSETWAYDYNTNAWTNMSPANGPSARIRHAMAYDVGVDRLILFGGFDSNDYNAETWAYDYNTNAWTNMSPAIQPTARDFHAMAYDEQSNRTVLFGGNLAPHDVFDTTTWLYGFPRPTTPSAPRSLHATEGSRKVALQWDPPSWDGASSITGYRLYRFTWPSGLSILATVPQDLTYVDRDVTNGVLYYYWVAAINAIGEGTLSDAVSATPRITLSAPSNLRAVATVGAVTLTWGAAGSTDGSVVTGYRLYRGTSDVNLALIENVGSVLGYTDANVTNGVMYHYQVSAFSGSDEGPRSTVASAMPREFVQPVVRITSPVPGSTVTGPSVVVRGTASDDVAVALVEVSTDGANWIPAEGTTTWSVRVTLAAGSQTIYVRVTDTSGNTATSSLAVTVTTEFLSQGLIAGSVAVTAAVGIAIWLLRKRGRRSSGHGRN